MVELRAATIDDLNLIANLHANSWRDVYAQVLSSKYLKDDVVAERTALWTARLKAPKANQLVLVAEHNNNLVGFICCFGENHNDYGSIIDNLHVSADCKGQGIGKRLIKTAITWLLNNYPNAPLYLEVLECNPKAIGFYQSIGAKELATAYWHTPCGNKAKEFLVGWQSLTDLHEKL